MSRFIVVVLFVLFANTSIAGTYFRLLSSTGGDVPFTVGVAFKKGDVPIAPTIDIANYQVSVKKLWNDGSVKHAVVSGHTTLVSGVQKTVNVAFSGTPPSGDNLTATDIQTAAPTASIQFGGLGTISLSSLLNSPTRTWVSGPEMVECHYQSALSGSSTIGAWFYVRLYKSGAIYVRVIADNSQVDVGATDVSYIPTVIIGETTIYNNGGASLTHSPYSRWHAEGWINATDPSIKILHDTEYLSNTLLVPKYWKGSPSESVLNGLVQTYTQESRGGWKAAMSDTGYSNAIGIMPIWDALYVSSGGDYRAFNSVLANAASLNSYGIVRRPNSTGLTPKVSDYPSIVGGFNNVTTLAGIWNDSHHGSGGYLAYLITGDYYYLDVMLDQAMLCYLSEWVGNGVGFNRFLKGQTRGHAWKLRTIIQALALAPTSDVQSDLASLLSANLLHWSGVIATIDPVGIGYYYEYTTAAYGTGYVAPWMQDFVAIVLGFGYGIEPLSSMATFATVKNYSQSGIVGRLGDSAGFCFSNASDYSINITSATSEVPDDWFKTWKEVETGTHGAVTCGDALLGTSAGNPSVAPAMGRWGIILPAIAYAVDQGVAGASSAWGRIVGSSNFSVLENSGFSDTPQWGIVPINENQPPPSAGRRYRYLAIE